MAPLAKNWLATVLSLFTLPALAAEPAVNANTADAIAPPPGVAQPSLADTFDLRSANVQKIVRATAFSQASSGYRIDAPVPRIKPTLAQMLREQPERVQRTTPAPRRPEKTKCDGFLSCGLETLLGLDEDERQFGRPRTVPIDQLLIPDSDEDLYEAWLSCQDTNNMLPTYERFEACNSARNTPPVVRDTTIDLPSIRP